MVQNLASDLDKISELFFGAGVESLDDLRDRLDSAYDKLAEALGLGFWKYKVSLDDMLATVRHQRSSLAAASRESLGLKMQIQELQETVIPELRESADSTLRESRRVAAENGRLKSDTFWQNERIERDRIRVSQLEQDLAASKARLTTFSDALERQRCDCGSFHDAVLESLEESLADG